MPLPTLTLTSSRTALELQCGGNCVVDPVVRP